MSAAIRLDLLIIGGGVAGLWILNRAVQTGYSALLVEKNELGSGQSVHSQGIIHGGTKYALDGSFTRAATAIAGMPERWRRCLDGEGEVDLSSVRKLSDETYFWSQGSLGARMTSFLASKALRGRVDAVKSAERPPIFRDRAFSGSLYRLAEPVLHVPSVIEALAAPVADHICKMDAGQIEIARAGPDGFDLVLSGLAGQKLNVSRIVLAAGGGFSEIAGRFGLQAPQMQLRPLHMVIVEHSLPDTIFGHCIGTSSVPLLSITSHPAKDGRQAWYMGGSIAETGVPRERDEQIVAAKETVARLLPWVDLGKASWDTLRIDRAEPATQMKARPDTGYAEAVGQMIVAWPTKLTLAPDLAETVLGMLPPPRPDSSGLELVASLPPPKVARPIWEQG